MSKDHLEFNKKLVYLPKKTTHRNYDNIINKVKYFQNKCDYSKQLCNSSWSP